MCKRCGILGQTLTKNRGSVYILCAGSGDIPGGIWKNARFSTRSSHRRTQVFSTNNCPIMHLLRPSLSTLSTRPITRAINEMKVM